VAAGEEVRDLGAETHIGCDDFALEISFELW
jgi:hypothetical protein